VSATTTVTPLTDGVERAHQTLLATVAPLRRNLFGDLDETVAQVVGLAGAYRNYGRNLVADVESTPPLDGDTRRHLERSVRVLTESIAVLVAAVSGPRDGTYVRSAALFDRVELDLEADASGIGNGQLAIRDLKLIDEAMAGLAATMALTVANYDTAVVDDAR
jgi:hypothetical protein